MAPARCEAPGYPTAASRLGAGLSGSPSNLRLQQTRPRSGRWPSLSVAWRLGRASQLTRRLAGRRGSLQDARCRKRNGPALRSSTRPGAGCAQRPSRHFIGGFGTRAPSRVRPFAPGRRSARSRCTPFRGRSLKSPGPRSLPAAPTMASRSRRNWVDPSEQESPDGPAVRPISEAACTGEVCDSHSGWPVWLFREGKGLGASVAWSPRATGAIATVRTSRILRAAKNLDAHAHVPLIVLERL